MAHDGTLLSFAGFTCNSCPNRALCRELCCAMPCPIPHEGLRSLIASLCGQALSDAFFSLAVNFTDQDRRTWIVGQLAQSRNSIATVAVPVIHQTRGPHHDISEAEGGF